jgi:hypothetical protein
VGGAFKQLINTAVEAGFADQRTYVYGGKDVDKQVHLGFDLASSPARLSAPLIAAVYCTRAGSMELRNPRPRYGLDVVCASIVDRVQPATPWTSMPSRPQRLNGPCRRRPPSFHDAVGRQRCHADRLVERAVDPRSRTRKLVDAGATLPRRHARRRAAAAARWRHACGRLGRSERDAAAGFREHYDHGLAYRHWPARVFAHSSGSG